MTPIIHAIGTSNSKENWELIYIFTSETFLRVGLLYVSPVIEFI